MLSNSIDEENHSPIFKIKLIQYLLLISWNFYEIYVPELIYWHIIILYFMKGALKQLCLRAKVPNSLQMKM